MSIFLILLVKLIPLYLIILVGYLAGKYGNVAKESVATLLIYIISPAVVFYGVATAQLSFSLVSLPFLFFAIASLFCGVFYLAASCIWKGSEKNILAYAAGSGNTGYFGLPVALALFGDSALSLVVFSTLGFILYENSVGFYTIARGQHSAKDTVKKLLGIPTLYVFVLGLLVNILHISLPAQLTEVLISFKGAYVVLGMMMVGVGLASITRASFDRLFMGFALCVRFVAWPVFAVGLIILDSRFFHLYNPGIYKIILLMAIVPLAANTVAFAAKLNTYPEKTAVTVLISTLLAAVYIPIFVALIFPFF